jgi:hypothetical protein
MFSKKSKPSNYVVGKRLKRALSLTLLVAAGLAVFAMPSMAGVDADPNLVRLEKKFFFKDFPKDDVDTRLDRLEKTVFGETKEGAPEVRLKNLVGVVPSLNPVVADDGAGSSGADASGGSAGSGSRHTADSGSQGGGQPAQSRPAVAVSDEDTKELLGAKYPQVDAMERKVFGKDYAGELIGKRIDRLETKVFGKTTGSSDLVERVDRLKSATNTDIARTPPSNSDWADDEDLPAGDSRGPLTYTPEPTPYTSPDGEDGRSFSGRDLRKDMQQAFGRPATGYSAGSGAYGMGSPSSSSTRNSSGYTAGSGSYGLGGGTPRTAAPPRMASLPPRTAGGGVPMPAPDFRSGSGAGAGDSVPPTAMGLSQQVGLLEKEIFGKTFAGETIPNRLGRLEVTVFPGQKSAADMALPERMRRLLTAVPVSQPTPKRLAQGGDPDFADLDDQIPTAPQPAPQRSGSGISRIVNGLGNLLTGGFATGAYPMNMTGLVTDPQTGMLWNRANGTLIDPVTGVIVGQKAPPMMMSPGGMGLGGFNSFNSGLSPLGSPYGMGGMGGMRFGFGGMGGSAGTIWP